MLLSFFFTPFLILHGRMGVFSCCFFLNFYDIFTLWKFDVFVFRMRNGCSFLHFQRSSISLTEQGKLSASTLNLMLMSFLFTFTDHAAWDWFGVIGETRRQFLNFKKQDFPLPICLFVYDHFISSPMFPPRT